MAAEALPKMQRDGTTPEAFSCTTGHPMASKTRSQTGLSRTIHEPECAGAAARQEAPGPGLRIARILF